jgi:uncharacterized membrane protein
MESYLLDWANLLLRWVHVITAIAWIGSSFYFVFLDSSLTPPVDEDLKRQGVSGELWAVHGGGFYHPVKFAGAPPQLPAHLHWFYWESYSTWLSGFSLFTVSYLWSAGTYLIDKSVMDWSPGAAVAVALSFLVVFWLAYDAICRTFGQRKNGDAIVGALLAVLVALAAWLACHWFAGRAAFLLVGAMLATSMSANVFFWIIPGQRTVVADLKAGKPVDPIHAQRGKQRSVHNTYFTLPVLFAMLSGHYSFTYTHPQNWLVLVLMMFAGAAIRQFFVLRHGFKLGPQRASMALCGGRRCGHCWRAGLAETPAAGCRRCYQFSSSIFRFHGARCANWLQDGAGGAGAALPPVPRRAGADEECAPGFTRGGETACTEYLPAVRGDQGHAPEQRHRHYRCRARPDQTVV